MTLKDLTWDQTLRFRLLEIVLQWEGRLTTNHLCTAFNIGQHPLLYPLVLANRDELVAKGCIFKLRSPDLRES